MKRKKGLIGAAAVLLAVLGWNTYQRQGVPILGQDTVREIIYVRDYRQGYENSVDVTEWIDGEKLAGRLETYQRRRGGSDGTPYSLDDVQVDIFIRTQDGPCQVLLGEENSASYGKERQYKILGGDVLLQEILEMIDG